jgi:phosphoribosylanthranilate isomerase
MNNGNEIAIKICGMRDRENILQVASLGPQYLGFIFYPGTPRFVGEDFRIPFKLPFSIQRVGVFVNAPNAEILEKVKTIGLDYVQLHGKESPAQCAALKAEVKIIKVFSVDENFDFDATKPYKDVADYFLFDTKGKYHGGNAKTFNWSILNKYDQEIPFFLSGGLSPDNVKDLGDVLKMNLHALDLNSGVEISPGLKDIEKVRTITSIAYTRS